MQIEIRRATVNDIPAITDIYNEAILTATATFDTEIKSVQNRREWFDLHGERHPILVATVAGKVVGGGVAVEVVRSVRV